MLCISTKYYNTVSGYIHLKEKRKASIKMEYLEARICGVISCDVTKTKFENSNMTSSSISYALYFCKVSQFQVTYFSRRNFWEFSFNLGLKKDMQHTRLLVC